MHPDHAPYMALATPARMNKAVNSLLGTIEGILVDGVLNPTEIEYFTRWVAEHEDVQHFHPFNEMIPIVQAAVSGGEMTQENRADIVWVCQQMKSTSFYNRTTADLQVLHSMLGGIAADGVITKAELDGLSVWIQSHEHLKTCWPYDEIDSIVTAVLADGRVDETEHKMLMAFFAGFVETPVVPGEDGGAVGSETGLIGGLCAVCPDIQFEESTFCFTGASTRCTRDVYKRTVKDLGGDVTDGLTLNVKYLVVGADGNPFWAYACYGRKVEKAMELRRSGVQMTLVHENDFHDALADKGIEL